MPRERIRVFYYPDMFVDFATVKKAVLFFDELHFMDRPSFSFNKGAFGLVGAPSPLRQFEQSFREEGGVPFFVHDAPGGPVVGELLDQISADLNDLEFLRRFQKGLTCSPTFRRIQIPPGNYGPWGNEENIYQFMCGVELATDLNSHASPSDLFFDRSINPFDLSTATGRAKNLLHTAAGCSAKLNFVLNSVSKGGFIPLADAAPFGDLMGAQYARAVGQLRPTKNNVEVTDLSFAIFDKLVPSSRLDKLTMKQVVDYRKKSEKAREAFLEHLVVLQAKHGEIGSDGDYSRTIEKLVMTEILPAARKFQNDLDAVSDEMFGKIAIGLVTGVAGITGNSVLQFLGDLSLEKILSLAAIAAGYVTTVGIQGIMNDRKVRRECSISYILSLDE
jgi:hypothetical protein